MVSFTPDEFTTRERVRGPYFGGRVVPKAVLEVLERNLKRLPIIEPRFFHLPPRSLVPISTTLRRLYFLTFYMQIVYKRSSYKLSLYSLPFESGEKVLRPHKLQLMLKRTNFFFIKNVSRTQAIPTRNLGEGIVKYRSHVRINCSIARSYCPRRK